jgi:hypothetical protein
MSELPLCVWERTSEWSCPIPQENRRRINSDFGHLQRRPSRMSEWKVKDGKYSDIFQSCVLVKSEFHSGIYHSFISSPAIRKCSRCFGIRSAREVNGAIC